MTALLWPISEGRQAGGRCLPLVGAVTGPIAGALNAAQVGREGFQKKAVCELILQNVQLSQVLWGGGWCSWHREQRTTVWPHIAFLGKHSLAADRRRLEGAGGCPQVWGLTGLEARPLPAEAGGPCKFPRAALTDLYSLTVLEARSLKSRCQLAGTSLL